MATTEFEPLNLLEHLDKLTKVNDCTQEHRYICPVCGGNDLTINKHDGRKFQCWSGGCAPLEIVKAVIPESFERNHNPSPAQQERRSKIVQKKIQAKTAKRAAELKSQIDHAVYMVAEGIYTQQEAVASIGIWAEENGFNPRDAKDLFRSSVGLLASDESILEVDPDQVKQLVAASIQFQKTEDLATQSILGNQIRKEFSVSPSHLERMGRMYAMKEGGGLANVGDVACDVVANILSRIDTGEIPGVHPCFENVESIVGRYQPGDLVIRAGRPAMGKTSFTMHQALKMGLQGYSVACYSLEMSKEQLVTKMLSCCSGINSRKLGIGTVFNQYEIKKLTDATQTVADSNVHISEDPAGTVQQIRESLLKFLTPTEQNPEPKLDVVMIDYLQLMDGAGNNRVEELSKITRGLKLLAQELKVVIVALSQLSRNVESRTNKRPMMSDLRESGSIEQDADIIEMCYREEYYDPETVKKGLMELITVKHRIGPTGTANLALEIECGRFFDVQVATNYPN